MGQEGESEGEDGSFLAVEVDAGVDQVTQPGLAGGFRGLGKMLSERGSFGQST